MRGHGKKMMQDKAARWLGAATFCLVSGAFAACAGSKTPSVSDELEDAIEDTFGNGSVGAAGSANGGSGTASGGRAGSANAGSANAGSANAGRAGGSSQAGNGGAASTGACDGFGILQQHCGGNNCHGAGTANGNFAENEDIAAAFAGQDPVTDECAMDGPLIDTENPRGSLLIQKVNGTVPCGLAMPLVGQLSEEDIDCLEEWIGDL
jgi:hypothetical protein